MDPADAEPSAIGNRHSEYAVALQTRRATLILHYTSHPDAHFWR